MRQAQPHVSSASKCSSPQHKLNLQSEPYRSPSLALTPGAMKLAKLQLDYPALTKDTSAPKRGTTFERVIYLPPVTPRGWRALRP